MTATRVLFVNGGILGLISFKHFLDEYLPRQSAISGRHVVLTSDLTIAERIVRRAMCQRIWRDGWLGVGNADLERFRSELHAGVLARRRMSPFAGQVDVLYFHRQATAYASLGLMRRIPSIVSVDCTQAPVLDAARSAFERATYGPNVWMDGAVFRRAAAIIATSQWSADSIRAFYPGCQTPIHVLHSPVRLDLFDPVWIRMRCERASPAYRPRLLFVGGDFPRKGGYDLLAAWEAGRFADAATLDVVTDWSVEGPVPTGVTLVRGITAQSQAWRAMWAEADIFVMPTTNEAFGLVYQEAAAAGLPAIGTRHNAVPEIVLDGDTGLLVLPGDREALIGAMRQLIESAELRARMGTRARHVIEDVAGPDAYMRAMTDIVLDAVKGRGAWTPDGR
jgi:glycosyltransferase involved in cell wall biosynthesis